MKIPEKVKIGGIDLDIVTVEKCVIGSMVCLAAYSSINQSIELVDYMPDQKTESVLLHEVLHGIFDFAGILLPEDQEEDLVERISSALYMVIIDNPEMFKED